MTQPAHTPGPWESNAIDGKHAGAVWTADGELFICRLNPASKLATPCEEEQTANAALIASAPDLLAALEAVMAGDGKANEKKQTTTLTLSYATMARVCAAIRRAKGE